MKFETLYARATSGKVQIWEIEIEGNMYRTIAGQQDGKKTTSKWTTCKGKNISRANETTPEEQAVAEAKAKWDKKVKKKYFVDIDEIDNAPFEVMLAHKWEDRKAKFDWSNGAYAQAKLDGARCVASEENGLVSRENNLWVSIPHIAEAMESVYNQNPDIKKIDGELYNHELKANFNKIISMIRKTKLSPEIIAESAEKVQYWIYDCYTGDDTPFSERYAMLEKLELPDCIKLLPTYFVEDEEELDKIYGELLEDGYEGQIIRVDAPYESGKRSWYLLKRKDFDDDEFVILAVLEGKGNRSDMAGRLAFRRDNDIEFKAGIRGNEKWYKKLWENKEKYVGQEATVRYFGFTPDGKPRFPVCTAVRDYE